MEEDLPLRQTYTRTLKKPARDQRFRNHPQNKVKARKADKKIKTIAGRFVRELERNLSTQSKYQPDLDLFKRVLATRPHLQKPIQVSLLEPWASAMNMMDIRYNP